MATAFLAKAVCNLTTTRQLLDRLCCHEPLRRLRGWTAVATAAESTFSRDFAAFAVAGTPMQI